MRVLIADDRSQRGKAIAEACAKRGHIVDRAVHGPGALEMVLQRLPDLVVCPVDLPVIGGAKLAEIVRANPNTRTASFLFLVEDELDAPVAMDARDRAVAPPWAEEDVLGELDAILEREARYGEMRAESEVEGRLSQISLVDLLQVFHSNRRSGTLRVHTLEAAVDAPGDPHGSIEIDEGSIVGAGVIAHGGLRIVGEKALFRLLAWGDGRFEFAPGDVAPTHRIDKPTRALLLEGVRQLDEWERLKPELPALDTEVRFAVDVERLPDVVHPVWREVLDAVGSDPRANRVIDACPSPDYQVVRGMHDLLCRDVLRVDAPAEPVSPAARRDVAVAGDLFTSMQLRRIRDWMDTQRTRPGGVLKAVLVASSLPALRSFLGALEGCTALARRRALPGEARIEDLGTLGELELGDGLTLRLCAVSPQPSMSPLWALTAHGSLGGVAVLDPAIEAASARIAPTLAALIEASGRPVAPVLVGVASEAEPQATHLRTGIEAVDREALIQLRDGSREVRLAIMRNVFSRIVP